MSGFHIFFLDQSENFEMATRKLMILFLLIIVSIIFTFSIDFSRWLFLNLNMSGRKKIMYEAVRISLKSDGATSKSCNKERINRRFKFFIFNWKRNNP